MSTSEAPYTPATDSVRKDTLAEILDAALELFTSHGYPAVTLTELAAAASTSEAELTARFSTTLAVLDALYSHIARDCAQRVIDAVDNAPSNFVEQLHAGVSAFVHALLDDPRRALLVGIEANGVSRSFDEKRRQERRAFASLIAQLAVTYEDRHIIELRLPALAYAGLVSALFEMVTEYALAPSSDRPPIDAVIDEIARFAKGVVVTPQF